MTQAALLALVIALPGELPEAPVATAVLCREADRRWPPIVWRQHDAPPQRVAARAGASCRVLIRRAASADFLASREVIWEERAAPIRIEPVGLREVTAPGAVDSVTWLGEVEAHGVECEARPGARCLFVPAAMAGVLISDVAGESRYAIVSAGASRVTWSAAAAARLVRVVAPAAQPVGARAITIGPVLKRGSSRMAQARPEPAVRITPVGLSAFWVEGVVPAAVIEFRAPGAAPLRLPLAAVTGTRPPPLEVRLLPEEVIDGDVRANGAPVEGATVLLSRINESVRAGRDEPPQLERVAEATTDSAGRFRFPGLGRERHDLLAVHPSLGRARVVVTPTGFPRLELKPRARVRGRVIADGIPVPSATIRVLPSLEAVAAAANPLLMASAPVASGADGRFEVVVPDEGRVVLDVYAGGRVQRVDLGEAASMGDLVEIGDIRLEEPHEIDVLVDLPEGCRLQAAGPLGVAGLSVVSLTRTAPGRWSFAPPARGRWLFAALCGKEELALDPAVVDLSQPRRAPLVLAVRR